MRTNRPNQGKFESWVSGRSATDHPCALHHQTCSWKALWPPPRTAGGIFIPQLNFPGCILPYFIRADPPVAVISYIWGGQNPCPRSLNLKVWADLWNSKSGLFLAVLWFCEIWAFSVANQMHSLVSSFQPLKLGSLVTRPLAAKIRGGLRPWMELLLNIPALCFSFWEVLWTASDLMDNLSMTAKQVFKSLKEVFMKSTAAVCKDGWGGQIPCPRSLNLKIWEDLWHSKSSISMLWLGWSSFSTSARCTSTTDEMKIRGGQNPCPLLSVKMNLTSIFLSSTFPGLSLPCIKLVSVFSCIWCHCW